MALLGQFGSPEASLDRAGAGLGGAGDAARPCLMTAGSVRSVRRGHQVVSLCQAGIWGKNACLGREMLLLLLLLVG